MHNLHISLVSRVLSAVGTAWRRRLAVSATIVFGSGLRRRCCRHCCCHQKKSARDTRPCGFAPTPGARSLDTHYQMGQLPLGIGWDSVVCCVARTSTCWVSVVLCCSFWSFRPVSLWLSNYFLLLPCCFFIFRQYFIFARSWYSSSCTAWPNHLCCI